MFFSGKVESLFQTVLATKPLLISRCKIKMFNITTESTWTTRTMRVLINISASKCHMALLIQFPKHHLNTEM